MTAKNTVKQNAKRLDEIEKFLEYNIRSKKELNKAIARVSCPHERLKVTITKGGVIHTTAVCEVCGRAFYHKPDGQSLTKRAFKKIYRRFV